MTFIVSIANGHVNGHVNGGAGTPNNSSFQRSNGAGFGRTASLRGPSTMASKMAKMEKDFRAEIERLQNVIDVTNQIIEERQVIGIRMVVVVVVVVGLLVVVVFVVMRVIMGDVVRGRKIKCEE